MTSAAQNLMNTIWAVPYKDRPSFVSSRLRGTRTARVPRACCSSLSTVITGAVSSTFGGVGAKIGGYVVSLIVNGALFFAAFRLMSDSVDPAPRSALGHARRLDPVDVSAVDRAPSTWHHASSGCNYGVFASVIPLIIWLHLGGQVFMYSAEVNVVTSRKLWPRSFFGPPEGPADKRTLRALAKVEERSEHQTVDVAFRPPPDPPQPPSAA